MGTLTPLQRMLIVLVAAYALHHAWASASDAVSRLAISYSQETPLHVKNPLVEVITTNGGNLAPPSKGGTIEEEYLDGN